MPCNNRAARDDPFAPEKPNFLTILQLILERSFFFRESVYVISASVGRHHPACYIFTPALISTLLGTEGPGVVLPYTNSLQMVEYGVGVLRVICDLHDNGCTILAIEHKLVDDGFHMVARPLISTVKYWYSIYQEF